MLKERLNNLIQGLSIIIIIIFFPANIAAQEFYLLGGITEKPDNWGRSYSWQIEYIQDLNRYLAASFSYLNEGHFKDHHRDGNTLQLWSRIYIPDRQFSLALGVGPYYYYDTTQNRLNGSSENRHDFGGMLSASAIFQLDSSWFFQLRSNWTFTGSGFDTLSTVAGIGYQLDKPFHQLDKTKATVQKNDRPENSITILGGQSIVNSQNSYQDFAFGLEYRRAVLRYLDWSAAWIYEGDSHLIRHNGLITQLWAVRPFFEDRMTLGVGVGAYISIDRYSGFEQHGNSAKLFSGIVSMTASYRFVDNWELRATWNRIFTNYNMDTDVIFAGLGYCF